MTSVKRGAVHWASAYSSLEILYSLYVRGVLKIDKENLNDAARDRFVLSKGHAAIGMYAVMEYVGILEENEMETFLTPGTRLSAEPCKRDLPWVEASSGSLGHGLPIGLGMALSQKIKGSERKTYVLVGDGECQEGSVWEAAFAASAHKADNLTVILDCNGLQKMNSTEETMNTVNWRAKWEAFGWQVDEVDGHDVNALCRILGESNQKDRPRIVIAHTVKGHGVPTMENDASWHFKIPKKKEMQSICRELEITEEL
ncbi:MAG: transketolase [Lachnospiraceae bacterium]|nr:transketolase [Lachnospiraceae bacterium]